MNNSRIFRAHSLLMAKQDGTQPDKQRPKKENETFFINTCSTFYVDSLYPLSNSTLRPQLVAQQNSQNERQNQNAIFEMKMNNERSRSGSARIREKNENVNMPKS